MWQLLLSVVLVTSAWSCRSQSERDTEVEVARIAYAVKQVRDAANNDKLEPLSRLRAESCNTPLGCELQQLCVQAYSLHQRSLETTAKVRTALRSGNAPKEAAADLLAMAEKDLKQAKQMIQTCNERERDLLRELR